MSTREKIDFYLNKWVSRKLTVFVVGSVGLFSGNLTSSDWVIIATAYITIEGITTIVEKLMKARGGIS
jgi:hypothetical protein